MCPKTEIPYGIRPIGANSSMQTIDTGRDAVRGRPCDDR